LLSALMISSVLKYSMPPPLIFVKVFRSSLIGGWFTLSLSPLFWKKQQRRILQFPYCLWCQSLTFLILLFQNTLILQYMPNLCLKMRLSRKHFFEINLYHISCIPWKNIPLKGLSPFVSKSQAKVLRRFSTLSIPFGIPTDFLFSKNKVLIEGQLSRQ